MLELDHARHGDVLVLRPRGRLDAVTANAFADAAAALAEAAPNAGIVLDLAALDYISSAGLRVVLSTARAAKAAGGSMSLCGLRGGVAQVMSVSGFDTVLPVHPDVDAALAAHQA